MKPYRGVQFIAYCSVATTLSRNVSAFLPYPAPLRTTRYYIKPQAPDTSASTIPIPRSLTSMDASLTVFPSMAKNVFRRSPVMTSAMLAGLALLFVMRFQRILYPGSIPDLNYADPLPPGKIGGCPYIGSFGFLADMNSFLHDRATQLGGPKIFKLFGLGMPTIVVSGSSQIRKLLGLEFKKKGGVQQLTEYGNKQYVDMLFGDESMSFETADAQKYHFLQKLVGQAMTPESIAKGMPTLQEISIEAVNRMLSSDKVVVADITHRLTLNVVLEQIIGLKLRDEEEIEKFHTNVQIWISSLTNFLQLMLPLPLFMLKRSKEYKAKRYLTDLIERKLDELESNGPDGSTLSGMLFARDDEDPSRTLTRQQIIDNIFVLIAAGSETSSLTLANVVLLAGMNPGVWEKLVKEQEDLITKYGPELTKAQIDKECPYAAAVIKESMRLLPITGGQARKAVDTIVMEGVQIPKNWLTLSSIQLTHEYDPKTRKEDGSHMDIKLGFNPDRWLTEETSPTTEFLPFGAGHRFCLGHHLATAEMRVFLAVMARKVKKFDLLTNTDKLKWKSGVIKIPKDGVVISPRKMSAHQQTKEQLKLKKIHELVRV